MLVSGVSPQPPDSQFPSRASASAEKYRDRRNGFLALSAATLGMSLGLQLRALARADLPQALGYTFGSLPLTAASTVTAGLAGRAAGAAVAAEDLIHLRPMRPLGAPVGAGTLLALAGIGLSVGSWVQFRKECVGVRQRCSARQFRTAAGLGLAAAVALPFGVGTFSYGVGNLRARRRWAADVPKLTLLPEGGATVSLGGRF